MIIQFTLQELLIFLAYVIGISAGILLLIVLWNIKKFLNSLRSLIETNQQAVNDTIATMPGIFENTEQISNNVSEATDKLKVSVPVIAQDVESISKVARENIELAGAVMENVGSGINDVVTACKKETSDYLAYYQILKEIFQMIYHSFSSGKK